MNHSLALMQMPWGAGCHYSSAAAPRSGELQISSCCACHCIVTVVLSNDLELIGTTSVLFVCWIMQSCNCAAGCLGLRLGSCNLLASIGCAKSVLQQVREEAKARGTSTLMLRRVLEATSGCTLLHFTCALWVYNCSGLPLALQKVGLELHVLLSLQGCDPNGSFDMQLCWLRRDQNR